MSMKLFFLALFAALVLVNTHEEDDFKEVENQEEEYMETEKQEDEVRQPRRFKLRFGRSRTVRSGGSTSSGFFRRSRTSGGTSGGSSGGFFRRSRTSGGTSGGSSGGSFRLRRTTSGGSSGGSRGGFRLRRNTAGGSSGGSRSSWRLRRTRTQTGGGSSSGGNNGNGGGTGIWGTIGIITAIGQLGLDIAQVTLTQMSNVERKIVITLGNLGVVRWQGSTLYMNEGNFLKPLPVEVAPDEGMQLGGVKKTGVSTTGVSGAFCYTFQHVDRSFCVMFKVPYSGDNYWNVKVYEGTKQASAEVYNDLQQGATKAGLPVQRKDIAQGVFDEDTFKIYVKDVSMTNSGQSILQVMVGLEQIGS